MDFETEVAGKRVSVRRRTRARELALQALYMLDQRGVEVADYIDDFIGNADHDANVRDYATKLVVGIRRNREEVDGRISAVAENWDLYRMAVVDRNILRVACFEMLHLDDIPPKVAINEAIDLAKKYSTEESGSFVNGILDKIKQEIGR